MKKRQRVKCHLCKRDLICTYLKAAHVPLYAFVCDECREQWVGE